MGPLAVSSQWLKPGSVCVLQRHPDGVASVAFKEADEADACILSFNGRWFGGRQLSAQLWDGATDYQVNAQEAAGLHWASHGG